MKPGWPWILVVLLAGCTQSGPGFEGTPPAEVTPPQWHIGDEWNYRNEEGQWRNLTVTAVETKGGVPAYRVLVRYAHPNDIGGMDATLWVDRISLGLIAYAEGGMTGEMSPPLNQAFPLTDRAYSSQYTASDGYSLGLKDNLIIHGWEKVIVPAGRFDAIHLSNMEDSQGTKMDRWYVPSVKNHVRELTDEDYVLVSWRLA